MDSTSIKIAFKGWHCSQVSLKTSEVCQRSNGPVGHDQSVFSHKSWSNPNHNLQHQPVCLHYHVSLLGKLHLYPLFLLASPSMNKLKQFYVVLKKYHPAFDGSFYVTGLCCPQYTTMHSHYLSYTFILVSLCLYCYVSNDFFPCLISAKNILLIHVPVVIFRLWKISFI